MKLTVVVVVVEYEVAAGEGVGGVG
jgi:hypothetical protein